MPRPGPRRILVGAKVHPDTAAALGRQATITGNDGPSEVARVGLELVASLPIVRRPGSCGLHGGAREEQMYLIEQPSGDQWWFCETTQQITQGAPLP